MKEEKNLTNEEKVLEEDRIRALNKIKNLGSDEDSVKGRLSLAKILGGDILTAKMIKSQIWLIVLVVIILVIYISNRNSSEQELREIDKLQKELADAKYKALASSSLLTERCRQSKVLELLKETNDSTLKLSDRPPYIIKTEE